MTATIQVVAAVVEEHGRLLITSRPEGVHLAGVWEFPGGKIAEQETHAAALAREIREELDAGILVHQLVFATTHDYPERTVSLYFYQCTLTSRPRPVLGQQVRWVLPSELADLEFPAADAELIRMLTSRRPAEP